jgi:rubrerythrin
MLGEPVINCEECGWPMLAKSPPPLTCPRCEYAKQGG